MMNNQYQNMYNPQPYWQYGNFNPVQYQPQVRMQQPSINGKIVPSVDAINANDVPMDGSVAIFPKQDMTEIYAKQWNADGTIRTVTFKPIFDNEPSNLSNNSEKQEFATIDDVRTAFREEMNMLYDKIEQISNKTKISRVQSKGSEEK